MSVKFRTLTWLKASETDPDWLADRAAAMAVAAAWLLPDFRDCSTPELSAGGLQQQTILQQIREIAGHNAVPTACKWVQKGYLSNISCKRSSLQ